MTRWQGVKVEDIRVGDRIRAIQPYNGGVHKTEGIVANVSPAGCWTGAVVSLRHGGAMVDNPHVDWTRAMNDEKGTGMTELIDIPDHHWDQVRSGDLVTVRSSEEQYKDVEVAARAEVREANGAVWLNVGTSATLVGRAANGTYPGKWDITRIQREKPALPTRPGSLIHVTKVDGAAFDSLALLTSASGGIPYWMMATPPMGWVVGGYIPSRITEWEPVDG